MPYIGGPRLSIGERMRRYRAALHAAPVVAEGYPHQCRCGALVVVKHRGRFYCRNCGRRWRYCPRKVITGRADSCGCPLPTPPAP
jgi:hypothetical protein